jgi:hypothetical protein
VSRTLRFLRDVLIPSVPRRPPGSVPEPWRHIFFHQTTVFDRTDPSGSPPPAEHWFFINGILTDSVMAKLNAAYLIELFGRPLTIIQNATDGPIFDLIECAGERRSG